MKQYVANVLSLSRIMMTIYLMTRFLNRRLNVNYAAVKSWRFLAIVALCILSDKLDGIVAEYWGSTSSGGLIDFYADRFCIIVLYYFLFPKSFKFFILALPELSMGISQFLCAWPTSTKAISIHPLFPIHLGRLSITLQSIGAFMLCMDRLYGNKYLRSIGNVILWSGTIVTIIAVIYYPIVMYQ